MAHSAVSDDLVAVYERGERQGADHQRRLMERAVASWLQRALANTLSSNVPGLGAASADPSWIDQALAQRAAPLQAFIAAVTTATITPGTGQPFVPQLPAPLTGSPAPATEKTELASVTVTVTGSKQLPKLIASLTDVSWQVMTEAGATVELLLREATLRATANYVVAQLVAAAGTAVASLDLAVAKLEAAGWPPSLLIGPTSKLLGQDLQRAGLAGLPVVPAPSAGLLVVSLPGCWIATTDTIVRQTEPDLGGFTVGAYTDVVAAITAGAVAAIT